MQTSFPIHDIYTKLTPPCQFILGNVRAIFSFPNLSRTHARAAETLKILEEEQREIDLFREYADYNGYVFYLMRKSNPQTKYFCFSR